MEGWRDGRTLGTYMDVMGKDRWLFIFKKDTGRREEVFVSFHIDSLMN